MTIYTPFFYIIQEISTGIYYAGARWAQDANPSTFLTEDGYQTSSKLIKQKIAANGLDDFIVRKIRTFDIGQQAYDYESQFLQRVDARNNRWFYNMHNNDIMDAPFGSDQFNHIVMAKYGVPHFSQSDLFNERMQQTCMDRYGVTNPMQSSVHRQTYQNALQQKYGVTNIMDMEHAKQKRLTTYQFKYNANHPMQTEMTREKQRTVMEAKYGVRHHAQTPEGRQAAYDRLLNDQVKEKKRRNAQAKYGADCYWQSEQGREEVSNRTKQYAQRECVQELRRLTKKYDVKIRGGWHMKPEEWVNDKIDEIKREYGEE